MELITGRTVFAPDDLVSVIGAPEEVDAVVAALGEQVAEQTLFDATDRAIALQEDGGVRANRRGAQFFNRAFQFGQHGVDRGIRSREMSRRTDRPDLSRVLNGLDRTQPWLLLCVLVGSPPLHRRVDPAVYLLVYDPVPVH